MAASVRLTIVATCACLAACAGPTLKPTLSPSQPNRDALLVIPGFGYSEADEKPFRALETLAATDGIDVYVPSYLSRRGLDASRLKLQRFIHDQRLNTYERLHVFAFIAGAWTFNRLVEVERLPNLTTAVYDRSPFQERAPSIAVEKFRLLARLRFGSTVFDMARTPYVPLNTAGVRVALMIETMPSSFIRRYRTTVNRHGSLEFECDAFMQPYDDCLYLQMDHDELYTRFTDVWPELRSFIRTGRFTKTANRTPPLSTVLR